MRKRRTVRPKRLAEPGPNADQLARIVGAAANAPDHGELTPWRFILVDDPMRHGLGQALSRAVVERDPTATEAQQVMAQEKGLRAPVLLAAICRKPTDGHSEIPWEERVLSLGCAIQNMLLVATAIGFDSALTTGRAMASQALREFLQLGIDEQSLCFINIGSATRQPADKQRPDLSKFFSILGNLTCGT